MLVIGWNVSDPLKSRYPWTDAIRGGSCSSNKTVDDTADLILTSLYCSLNRDYNHQPLQQIPVSWYAIFYTQQLGMSTVIRFGAVHESCSQQGRVAGLWWNTRRFFRGLKFFHSNTSKHDFMQLTLRSEVQRSHVGTERAQTVPSGKSQGKNTAVSPKDDNFGYWWLMWASSPRGISFVTSSWGNLSPKAIIRGRRCWHEEPPFFFNYLCLDWAIF